MNDTSDGKTNVRPEIWISLFLVLSTLAVYWQIKDYGFVYDDNPYIVRNVHVRNGLTWEGVSWAFTSFYEANWHPLSWLSHMSDCQLYGMNPGRHHLTSLIFHIINTLLLFFILKKMTGAVWQSGFVAALFALHPLHAESVVWIAERKDMLSTFFWLLTMIAYVRYAERPFFGNYLSVLIWFICALMSKPMAVTLPCVLLLLDYWPLNRIRSGAGIIWEKIPLFLLSAISCIITFIAQKADGAVANLTALPIDFRLANASVSYLMYLWKMVCPFQLSIFYPIVLNIPLWQSVGALFCLGYISVLTVRKSEKYPFLLMGWLWYLGTLLPVIGLIQVGSQSMADRYTYVTFIGIFIMIAYGIPQIVSSRYYKAMGMAAAGIILMLAIRTWDQARYWEDGITLYEHAIRVTENNYLAHYNLGCELMSRDRTEEAIPHFSETIRINPAFSVAQYNLGKAYRNDPEKAIYHYSEYIAMEPGDAFAHNNLGVILVKQGKMSEAVRHFSIALGLSPNNAEIRNNLNKASSMLNTDKAK
jgi:hypothetical protein